MGGGCLFDAVGCCGVIGIGHYPCFRGEGDNPNHQIHNIYLSRSATTCISTGTYILAIMCIYMDIIQVRC